MTATLKRAYIRSTLFNACFYAVNILCCFALLPALLLPRNQYLKVIDAYHYIILAMEIYILGLKYKIRGIENLPEKGPYIVAAKHQSPYETLKLRLLFPDPAIILKKELLSIPVWGQFLKKSDVIAIDRSTPDTATASIKAGAKRVKTEGRPIVIFPQGTRTWPHQTTEEKPYKSGVHRIFEATNLAVIPMATNSGMFWPRSGWLKSSGTVIFEFLPAINPPMEKTEFMSKLEEVTEKHSLLLMQEALENNGKN